MKIIFHYPLPLNYRSSSASGIRPVKMLNAFKNSGYDIDIISGYSKHRILSINKIKKNIRSGVEYKFIYSESSTMPTLLTDKHHYPLHPHVDFSFFSMAYKNRIPIGLFYRDIYWLFPIFKKKLSFFKRMVSSFFYRYDLYQYDKYVTKLYLPSKEMAQYIKINDKYKFDFLPPGHDVKSCQVRSYDSKISLLYVGGISQHYQMHKLFEVLLKFPNIDLTVCTREDEWKFVKNEYSRIPQNVTILHKSGNELQYLYEKTNIAILFVKPSQYYEFAVPFKLFEYIGYGKPIIATEGTFAGQFVTNNNIGWTIPYSTRSLERLLDRILSYPHIIDFPSQLSRQLSPLHTWEARAGKVIEDLKN